MLHRVVQPVEGAINLAAEREHASDADAKDPAKDAMLRETGNILLDYIGLTRQIAFAETVDPHDQRASIIR